MTAEATTQQAPPKRELLRFKLCDGQHMERDPHGRKDQNGNVIMRHYDFRRNNIIETYTDLNRLNAKRMVIDSLTGDSRLEDDTNYPKKFERILDSTGQDGSSPVNLGPITAEEAARRGFATALTDAAKYPPAQQPVPADVASYVARLEKMSVKELQAHAADEEVDLKGEARKDQIIKILRAGFGQ